MFWLDGERIEGSVAPFDLRDRGLSLGDGVFDTALVLGGRAVFAARHIARLAASCAALGIPVGEARIAALIAQGAAAVGTGALRLTVTRGTGPRGLAPPPEARPCTIMAATPGAPGALWRPVAAATASIRRNETSPGARHKCLNYLDAALALQEAAAQGAQEALFLNAAGRVACASVGNVFILRGGRLVTPPLADGVLDGVVRAELLALAPSVGLIAGEASLAPSDLMQADAAFMTNSLRLVAPLTALDGAPLGSAAGLERLVALARALAGRIGAEHGRDPGLGDPAAFWPVPG